jgi:predicted nuclease of predicted toxin-antitoxin system
MRLLFDENLSFKLSARLADVFPGSSQVRLLGLAQADDRAIWNFAGINGFTIVSLDVDFADRATLIGPPPKVIWLRCGNQPTEIMESCCAITSRPSLLLSTIPRHVWRSTSALTAKEADGTSSFLVHICGVGRR